jgi:hypothetical protein
MTQVEHGLWSRGLTRLLSSTPGRLAAQWLNRVAWLLEFEPTWFPEFGLGIAAFGWGLGQVLTDEIHVFGEGFVLPCFAMILGLSRCMLLMPRWYAPRVFLSGISALFWAWLFWALAGRYGIIGMMGMVWGLFVTDVLTACKFSMPCARDFYDEHILWRLGK